MIDFSRILEADYLESFKVGKIARQVLMKIIQIGMDNGKISKAEIDKFRTETGRHTSTFMISKPLLSLNRQDCKGYYRYYADPIAYNSEMLYLYKDWDESDLVVKDNLIKWIREWIKKHGSIYVTFPNVFKGEEQIPYVPPQQGRDKNRQLVYYHENVPEDQRVEDLCRQLECEYLELVYNFARNTFEDCFEHSFPEVVKVVLCKECPSRIYVNSDEYVAKKVNQFITQGKLVTTDDIAKILRFKMRIAGEFIAGDIPYIKIYFNQFVAESMEEYVSMVTNVLAHEFSHYLEYEYCQRHGVKHYQDARVSEAIADFFGVLYSRYRSGQVKHTFDMQVAEKRYNKWKERVGSGWPYAYSLYFLKKPYKDKFSEYSDAEIDVAREKLIEVFKSSLTAKDAINKLTK